MAETTQLEKFLSGEPLTKDLADLAEGKDFEPEQAPVVRSGDLSDDDREHLRRLKYEPGFPILLSLIDDEISAQKKLLEIASTEDPLANRDQLAQGWAYIAMQKKVRNTLVSRMEEEIQKLQYPKREDEE